jgi:uncharacterized membrane protein YdjX (TVP38/TMEM64 family)
MRRSIVLMAAAAAVVIASKLLIENVLGISLEPFVAAWLERPGAGSAALIVGLLAADVLFTVPSSVVMVLSGAAFGVWWGALLALVGSIAGEWLGFELVRRYGRRATRWLADESDLVPLDRFFARHGALAVVVTRPLPVVMETMTLVAGLSQMPRWQFVLASLAGTTPIVLVYAQAGAVSREIGSALPAIVILVAMAAAGWVWHQSRHR